MTGAVRLRFQWSDEGLDSITEPGERITRIRRDENGIPVSIATSRGYRTRLGVRDGWLAAVVDPSNQITRISARADASLPNFTTQSAPGPCSATTLGAADRHRRTDGSECHLSTNRSTQQLHCQSNDRRRPDLVSGSTA